MTQPHLGITAASGALAFEVIRAKKPDPPSARSVTNFLKIALRDGLPTTAVEKTVNRWRIANLKYLSRGMRTVILARVMGLPHFHGALRLQVIRAGTSQLDLGLVGLRVVTDTGVGFIVDAFQNLTELETMKYHGLGTGSTAEAAAQTALVAELTTEYNPDNTRATGNLSEGATGNIFHTEGTNTLDAAPAAALREHSVFSQAATGGGVMFDRTLFAAITLNAGDGLLSKYELTLNSGG